jgi:hypothetical protein
MQQAPKIRQLMPAGFVTTLADRTGLTDPSAVSKLVKFEQAGSKYWPTVLALAEETDPEGYAAWAAANPKKLPKVAA